MFRMKRERFSLKPPCKDDLWDKYVSEEVIFA